MIYEERGDGSSVGKAARNIYLRKAGLNSYEWATFAEESAAWNELTREAEEAPNMI